VKVAAVPPALLAIEPVQLPAVGDEVATATAKVTEAPGDDAVAEPTGAIVATVPGALFAPTVQMSVGVNVGANPLCETVRSCVVGDPPITSAMLLVEIDTGPGDGDGDGDAVGLGEGTGVAVGVGLGEGAGVGVAVAPAVGDGEGLGVAVPVVPISSKTAGTFAARENGEPFAGKGNAVPSADTGPAHVKFHCCRTGSK
jgi:hypothetical protein